MKSKDVTATTTTVKTRDRRHSAVFKPSQPSKVSQLLIPPYRSSLLIHTYNTLIAELEKVRNANIALRIAYHETHRGLEAVSVQRETLQEMTTIVSFMSFVSC